MINKFDIFCEGAGDEKQLNWIIDKISNYGENSLTKSEKDFLNNYKEGRPSNISSEADHYNKFILSLLKDLKENNITEEHAQKFVDKFIDKKDLFDFILTLLKKNKLEFLLLNHSNEEKEYKDFNIKNLLNEPSTQKEEKPRRKKGKYIKIPNFNKY